LTPQKQQKLCRLAVHVLLNNITFLPIWSIFSKLQVARFFWPTRISTIKINKAKQMSSP